MRFSLARILVLALATETAVASSWFTKAPYDKWHQTELERWLSDHDVPYPKASDRKELENLVKKNWQSAIESPYVNWDTDRLQKYLSEKGTEVKKGTEKNKDALVSQVKSTWHDADAEAHSTYGAVQDWIFNTWTESSLKSFCDKHGIPVPQPRKRDQALKAVRENYQTAANKIGETAAYPGNWLYESWSESDLKAWLDKHGVPVPQKTPRDKLIASVRRNAYLSRKSVGEYVDAASSSGSSLASGASSTGSSAADNAYSRASSAATDGSSYMSSAATDAASSASSAAGGAYDAVKAKIFDSWSDSQLKEWADKNGIKVPQGSKRNELLALARKNIAKLSGDNVSGSAANAYGAATSSAGNQYGKASGAASSYASAQATGIMGMINSYVYEAQVLLGLKTNYASSVSGSASSAYSKATSAVKGEL